MNLQNRLWRKNRSPQSHLCNGVDLNRNFDDNWQSKKPHSKTCARNNHCISVSETGSSARKCHFIYAGPSAASELETQALSQFVSIVGGQTKIYLSMHSYGQYIMFPYGHTKEKSPFYDDQVEMWHVKVEK